LGQLLVEEPGRVNTGSGGHRGVLLRVGCGRSLERSTRWPRLRRRHALTQVRRTPLCWTQLSVTVEPVWVDITNRPCGGPCSCTARMVRCVGEPTWSRSGAVCSSQPG
jgi:hypothetical protein